MKILGITAEYNPFHNGHRYHAEKSAEITGADYTVAVMSGCFTQRGEAALLDKWTRAGLAVENGIDLVIELPFIFACSRADTFAEGAIDILEGIGVDTVSFGSESGDLESLMQLAEIMVKEHSVIEEIRLDFAAEGISYVKSYNMAVEKLFGKDRSRLMAQPNNILALEYLKRMLYWEEKGRCIEAVTVKRHGSGYFDTGKEPDETGKSYAGASAIRRIIDNGEDPGLYVSDNVLQLLEREKGRVSAWEEKAFDIIRSEIVKSSPESLSQIYCMGEGLENKLKKEIRRAEDLRTLISAVVSKRYTEAAVRRLLIYVMMGMRFKEPERGVYARVLAAGEGGRKLLKYLKKSDKCHIPVITNINRETEGLDDDVTASLKMDELAADMYNIVKGRDMYLYSDRVVRPYIKQSGASTVGKID